MLATDRFIPAPQAIKLEKLLLTEGKSPSNLFEALAKEIGLSDIIEIRDFRGVSELAKYLKTLAATAEMQTIVKSLGIVRDAEKDAQSAKQSVQSAISGSNLPTSITVNVHILPDETNPGMLETLCMKSVEKTAVFPCVESFFECIAEKGIVLPEGIHRDKHRAQVYLATCSESQLYPGYAARKGIWPLSDPAYDAAKAFLKSL